MSYKPNTYIDDVAFKQALTSYNEKIKNTYTNIPEEDAKFLGGSVYCCKKCLEKEWRAT